MQRLGDEYRRVAHLTLRDAKHAYLQAVAGLESYGCDVFFPVKEVGWPGAV